MRRLFNKVTVWSPVTVQRGLILNNVAVKRGDRLVTIQLFYLSIKEFLMVVQTSLVILHSLLSPLTIGYSLRQMDLYELAPVLVT